MYSVIMHETPQQERFRILYQANYGRILGYALRRTASADNAADVVAETFAIAWRKYADIPSGEEATLWLYGVARRVLWNQHRKEQSRSAVIDLLAREYEEAVWTDADPRPSVVSRPVIEAWIALKPADRDLLGLLLWETLTTQQIAAVVGCPRAAVKVRIHRARRRFAHELERRGALVRGTGPVKPSTRSEHVQAGRADVLPDTEVV